MDDALLANLQRYLDDHCSLHELEVWLLSNLQSILNSGNEAVIQIANDLDVDLIQLGEGLIEESTIKDCLRSSRGGPMMDAGEGI